MDWRSEDGFLTLMIISHVVITLVVLIGAYFIFKPVFKKDAEKREEREKEEKEQEGSNSETKTP